MSRLRDTLAEMVRLQANQGPLPTQQQLGPVSQELLNIRPGIQPFVRDDPSFRTDDPRGPSPLNRLIDVLSRPLYGVMNPIKVGLEEGHEHLGSVLGAMGRGFAGKDKTLGSDVLEASGMESGAQRGILGFGLDVLADPLTYVGVGLAGKLGRGAKQSVAALGTVEKDAARISRELAGDIQTAAAQSPVGPERVFQAGPGREIRGELTTGPSGPPVAAPQPTIGARNQVQDPERIFEVTPSGSASVVGTMDTIATPIPKPQSGREILEDLLQGELQAGSKGRAQIIEKQLREMTQRPSPVARQNITEALREMARAEKSPVVKNMIAQQLRKVEANVNPAEALVGQAGRPISRPPIRATERQRVTADEIAENFLKTNKHAEINPVGQSNLLDRIYRSLGELRVPKKQRPAVALNMLRQAEEVILRQGRKLVDKEGRSTRLSDIGLAAEGRLTTDMADAFRKGTPDQAVETAVAQGSREIAEEVVTPVLDVARRVANQTRDLPPSRTAVVGNDLARELSKIAEAAGASKHDANKAKAFIKDLFDFNQDALYSEAGKQARAMMRMAATGKAEAKAIDEVSKAVYASLGGTPKAFGKDIPQNKVVEAFMLRFSTHWGAKDLRPFAKEFIDSARNIAAAFEQSMAPLVRATSATQRHEAWNVARGATRNASPSEVELGNRFQTIMETLMGAEGVATNAGNSVVTRAGVTMADLNRELARGNSKLRFINEKGVDDFGRAFDYSGENWLNSWKAWDAKEPVEAIYELTRALQLVTRKNSFLDEFAARWAMPVKSAEFNVPIKDIPRLDGFYTTKELSGQLKTVWDFLDNPQFKYGDVFKHFDTLQRAWKSGVTIYSPSHHIRNLNGDIFLSMLDGVISPRPYTIAARVLHAHRRRYKDLEFATNMTDAKWRKVAATQPGDTVVTTKGGHKLTAEQVMLAAEQQGFLLRAPILEDLVGQTVPWGLPGKARGRAHGVAAAVSENRDHWVRLAHFIDLLRKDKGKSLRDVYERAGRRVRKFHPDGSDLTGFEQTVMRRLIPFYSWIRKSTPLVLEGMVMRPHISLAMPKGMAAIQDMTGIESEGPGNPFPVDSMFPDWIREKGIGPIFPPGHPMAGLGRQETWQGDTPGYTIVNPTSPFMDQMMEVFNPKKTIMGGLTPALRLPAELLTGHTSLGVPLDRVQGGVAGHLGMQVPPVGVGARVTGMTRPDEPYHPEQLINWLLTGGLVTGTGPHRQQGQIEIREHLKELGRKNVESLR
jgi:hypothetical protein